MHTFQPITANDLDLNIFNIIGNDWMLVTAQNHDKINTMTASWGGLGVMWNKNVAYIFIRDSRYTKEFIDYTDTFSLSFFGGAQKNTLKYLGAVSGRDENKIANSRLTPASHNGTPYFDEAVTILICKKIAYVPIHKDCFIDKSIDTSFYKDKDYHNMYIAEILDILAR